MFTRETVIRENIKLPNLQNKIELEMIESSIFSQTWILQA